VLLAPDPVGTEYIVELLGWPEDRVVRATTLLQDDHLLTHEARPTVTKNLFKALADVWCVDQPEAGLADEPMPGNSGLAEALMLGLSDPENEAGWALGGKLAAAAWGLPVGNTDGQLHFYVPSEPYLRRAETDLGRATGAGVRAMARVSPMYWITRNRIDGARRGLLNSHWPIVHPLVSALEVGSVDPGLLSAWVAVPPELAHRPWL
jgi:hypothetical protein